MHVLIEPRRPVTQDDDANNTNPHAPAAAATVHKQLHTLLSSLVANGA